MCLFKIIVLLAFLKSYNGKMKGPPWKNISSTLISVVRTAAGNVLMVPRQAL